MYAAFFIYSLASIFSKLAARQVFLSLPYLLCLCAIIMVMGIYAVLWQQVLKVIPVSVAMANKPVVLVFSLLWAVILFKEHISQKMLFGVMLILCGVCIIGKPLHGR